MPAPEEEHKQVPLIDFHKLFMGLMHEPTTKEKLRKFIEVFNATHEQEEHIDVDAPDFTPNRWSVSQLATALSEAGVKTRVAGREMDKSSLLHRFETIYSERPYPTDWVVPSPNGENWRAYWGPIIGEAIWAVLVVIGTVLGVYAAYYFCEEQHYKYQCRYLKNMYSLQCFVLKKSRSYLEEMNYNIVYSVACGLGVFLSGFLMRLQKYAARMV